MTELTVAQLPVGSLKPYDRNARTHSDRQIAQIAASITAFGFNNPVLIDKDGGIIAGHGRVAAARKLRLVTVPCVRLDHLDDAQKRAYILADNRLAEKAGWDPEILKIELQHLTSLDLDFDVTVTGFEIGEIDVLIGGEAEADAANEVPPPAAGPAVTRLGDIWQIGRHRLVCGDATDPATHARLLAGERAQMVFTDPPYNVRIDGHVCGLGDRHREFAMASGEMSAAEFTAFLAHVFANLAAHAADGAIHFVCMDWRHLGEVMAAAAPAYSELKNLCVWAKSNGGMGSLYRSQHELVFVYKSGRGAHINNVALAGEGRQERRARQMSAFEVGLRAQVKAALKYRTLRAIRSLVALAAKHELFKPPPPPKVGGVVVWPGLLDLEPGDDVFAHLAEASTSKREADDGGA